MDSPTLHVAFLASESVVLTHSLRSLLEEINASVVTLSKVREFLAQPAKRRSVSSARYILVVNDFSHEDCRSLRKKLPILSPFALEQFKETLRKNSLADLPLRPLYNQSMKDVILFVYRISEGSY